MAISTTGVKCFIVAILFIFVAFGKADEGSSTAKVDGYRVEDSDGDFAWKDNGAILYFDMSVTLRLFGVGLSEECSVSFTTRNDSFGHNCDDIRGTESFNAHTSDASGSTTLVDVILPMSQTDTYYLCLRDRETGDDNETKTGDWTHQGSNEWVKVKAQVKPEKSTIFPFPVQIILIIVLLCMSGLFSGLNLGLMSLDKTELQIIANSGTDREKRYAKIVGQVRKRGNYLLCTILLGNVLVNNTLTILMDDLTGSGPVAIVAATIGIVIFGEIIPQAVCSRYGLAIGANTIWFTRIFMVLTFPLSFPISKILDCVLGEEMGIIYKRDRLRELIKVTEEDIDLKKDEVNIIAGALSLSKKTVEDIMTDLESVYMLEYSSVLDFETVSEIMKTGFTRVPVFEKERSNVIALLNIKDLAFIDTDDRTPLKSVCKFYNHPVNFVFNDTKLDAMLEEFKKGQCHLAFVRNIVDDGEGDPYYQITGVVTLEDVIEEIIQSEIIDETDTVLDNKTRQQRKAQQHKDFTAFHQQHESDLNNYPRMSPQLTLATFQYLSTTVPAFKPELISETVLQRLLKQNVIAEMKQSDAMNPESFLYHRGKPADYFVLVLQGRVEVDIGKEHMIFEGGPFMYFGIQALTGSSMSKAGSVSSISSASDSIYAKQTQHIPDFTVRAITHIQYLKIRRAHYVAARRATMMERQPKAMEEDAEDAFSKEWKRAISIDPEIRGIRDVEKDSLSGITSLADGELPRTRTGTSDSIALNDSVKNSTVTTPLMSKKDTPLMSKKDKRNSVEKS